MISFGRGLAAAVVVAAAMTVPGAAFAAAAAVVAPVAAQGPVQVAQADRNNRAMTGDWTGEYRYPGDELPPVAFTAEFNAAPDFVRFSGVLIEPNTFGAASAASLVSDVVGTVGADGSLGFVKRYDGGGGVTHIILYHGRYNDVAKSIEGVWFAETGYSGTFTMTRVR